MKGGGSIGGLPTQELSEVDEGKMGACTTSGGTNSDRVTCFRLGHEVEEQW